ncbi:MAG: hypothetical protein AUK50_04560 [Comamonadaceae bacterium CG2_30_57_122]|nr:MAG: hypothetical protein AUK50_04560 [Comamonadaceae bacterium CG2_30_57_122]
MLANTWLEVSTACCKSAGVGLETDFKAGTAGSPIGVAARRDVADGTAAGAAIGGVTPAGDAMDVKLMTHSLGSVDSAQCKPKQHQLLTMVIEPEQGIGKF